ncbi:MAG: DUF4912 domain-containing protein [Candidatus Wallbacteria bacterium]|nr:DUF4912 domain-containing protein [Candidatus Wallbacteria bacterium]
MEFKDDFKPMGSSGQPKDEKASQQLYPGERLPKDYGKTKMVLMVVDPLWLHTYWLVTPQKIAELVKLVGEAIFNASRFVIRVYDVTDVDFNGENAHSYFDMGVSLQARNWYFNCGNPDRNYLADLGLITPEGKFVLIARSNTIRAPRNTISEQVDDRWISIEQDYAKMYQLSGGEQIGRSSFDIKEIIARRFQEELSSGSVSSFSSGSVTGLQKPPSEKSDFWLKVETELIVYGATEPDADLSVKGMPIKLRPDGTFTLRFALPDGEQVIPVEATSASKKHHRVITPVVNKVTR